MIRKAIAAIALALSLCVSGLAMETPAQHGSDRKTQAVGAQSTAGEVRKVDRDAQKITIKHGPIPNLDMPAMTMVFRVKEPSMLDQVKAGDKIRFRAESTGGALTLIELERTH